MEKELSFTVVDPYDDETYIYMNIDGNVERKLEVTVRWN